MQYRRAIEIGLAHEDETEKRGRKVRLLYELRSVTVNRILHAETIEKFSLVYQLKIIRCSVIVHVQNEFFN